MKPRSALMILFISIVALATQTHSASAPIPTTLSNAFCSGTTTPLAGQVSGAIPATSILSGATLSNEQSVLNISLLIMLIMMLIASVFYMISNVLNLGMLKEFAKDELWEVVVTAGIVIVILGGFNLAAAGITNTTFHITKGANFGRQTYVDDCSYLLNNSVNLLPSLFTLKTEIFLFDVVESGTFNYKPLYFGISIKPFEGYNLFDKLLNLLSTITMPLILMQLGVIVLLGFIFGLFPIFLYAGIILRTLPWTRAAGGAMIGLFIGFYIVFPILLHIMISGYTLSNQQLLGSNPMQFGSISQLTSGISSGNYNSAPGLFTYWLNYLEGMLKNGLVNSYITEVIEPGFFSIVSIIISFMISYDIVEIAGDLLGAPSLSAGGMFRKMIK